MPNTITLVLIAESLFVLVLWSCLLFIIAIPCLFVLRKIWNFPKVLNFKGEFIPTGYGLTFVTCYIVLWTFLFRSGSFLGVRKLDFVFDFIYFFLPLFVMGIGYLDDARGQKDIKGLTKNLKHFVLSGHITSSLMKAIVVVVCATLFSILLKKYAAVSISGHIVNVLLISLCTNFLNLLDVRPGRVTKIFSLLIIVPWVTVFSKLFMMNSGQDENFWKGLELTFPVLLSILPIFASVLAYAPLDFRGQAMMGDAGSNMLGFVLGIGYAVILPLPAKIAVVILLTLFHIYCEFYSFSDFISRNKVLRWLDEWGTCMRKDREQGAGRREQGKEEEE